LFLTGYVYYTIFCTDLIKQRHPLEYTYCTSRLIVQTVGTSKVTGHHRGPKRKLPAGYRVPSYGVTTVDMLYAISHIFAHWTSWSSVMNSTCFIIKCSIARFLFTMRVFDIQASSSSPRLPLCKNFISVTSSIAELVREE